jgi:IS5 family transposase
LSIPSLRGYRRSLQYEVAKRDECRPAGRLRDAGDLRSLAADKGYDDMSFREKLRSEGVKPFIKHCVFTPHDHAHNARIEDDLYNQRSVC